jgi:hypothetical protein
MAVALCQPGCVTLPTAPGAQARSLVPTRYKLETGPYVIYTNNPLPNDAPEVVQLVSLEDQLQRTLGLEVDPHQDPIEIYILDDRQSFNHFLTFYYSELPPRRAFFFAQGPRRVVYTFHGKSLEQDLRHEATHALLHAAVSDVPLWLDEGLAEYFEVDPKLQGVNPEHLGKLRSDVRDGWSPDLPRLEHLTDVRQMGPGDYREAWAWTHFFLETTPENRETMLVYLHELARGRDVAPLSSRIRNPASQGEAMVTHIAEARATLMANSRPAKHETYRFQDEPLAASAAVAEAPPAPANEQPPRGPIRMTVHFFERLFAPLRSH